MFKLKEFKVYKLEALFIIINIYQCHGYMEGKIVGGKYGNIEDFPHAVCLNAFCSSQEDAFWVCGSSVLNQRILLTAAHCVDECKHYHRVVARAGSTNVKKSKAVRLVMNIKIHDYYDKPTLFHDIALCMLSGNLPLGKYIKRAILRRTVQEGTHATLAGWGVIDEDHTPTLRLKFVKQKLWTARACNKWNKLMPGTFCASSGSEDDYPFAGDSGSGLVTHNQQVIGLVSYRIDDKPELTYYTNVSYFLNWIHRNAPKLVC